MVKSFSLQTVFNYEQIKYVGKTLLEQGYYSGIEIRYPFDIDNTVPEEYTDGVNFLREEYSPLLSLHISYELPFASNSKAMRVAAVDMIKKNIEYGAKCGAKIFPLHLPEVTFVDANILITNLHDKKFTEIYLSRRSRLIELSIQFLQELSLYLNDDMFIVIENSISPTSLVRTAEDLLMIINMVNKPNIRCMLDVAHSFVAGFDPNLELQTLGDRLKHLHISDNFGKWDNTFLLGKGMLNFYKIFQTLREINYDSAVVIESVYTNPMDLVESSRLIERYMLEFM